MKRRGAEAESRVCKCVLCQCVQLRAKMERLFWEQLIVSLTPSTQASTDELTVGAVGQVRTQRGPYYIRTPGYL